MIVPIFAKEEFKPIKNEPPSTLLKKVKFYGRMLLDLQLATIYADIKKELPYYKGKVLDVGCGQSPYKFLLNEAETEYKGIDVKEATEFDYINKDVIFFDGKNIPFNDDTFDGIICTEVLEHVHEYQSLINELYRVAKPGAKGIITIPFSTRYHYIPHDYYRYTPSALEKMFSEFSVIEITSRGTDVLSICAKIIILFFRNLTLDSAIKIILLPFWIAMLPVLVVTVAIAHICKMFNLGSDLDPLGYTIKVVK